MTFDEFESWLDDHRDETLARLDDIEQASLTRWTKLFGRALVAEATADEDEDEESLDDDDVDDDLDPEV